MFAVTPEPPYVAVIFSSRRTDVDHDGYAAAAARMVELAAQQPGFLGVESARSADGLGLTVSYWATESDAVAWRAVAEHAAIQQIGRERWYDAYRTRVAVVHRASAWQRDRLEG